MDEPEDCWLNDLWTVNRSFWFQCEVIYLAIKNLHSIRNFISTVNHDDDSVMIRGCFAASESQPLMEL